MLSMHPHRVGVHQIKKAKKPSITAGMPQYTTLEKIYIQTAQGSGRRMTRPVAKILFLPGLGTAIELIVNQFKIEINP
jgi:hypothetical protein